jgi:lipoate-protein ligase A
MHFLNLTLADPAANLALDEALLLAAESGAGGELLRMWEWPSPAVVLGSGCRLAEDVNESSCLADGVPILRRSSGGGTVLWGRGCLLFSLVLAYDNVPELSQVGSSYRYILGRVGAALGLDGVRHLGTSDLAVGDRKFSGNAQQRKRAFLLHHGTLLHDFEFTLVGRYLRPPTRQPQYRLQRTHEDFLCKLPLAAEAIKQRLRAAWHADVEQTAWPEETVRRLCDEKYARRDWTRRR